VLVTFASVGLPCAVAASGWAGFAVASAEPGRPGAPSVEEAGAACFAGAESLGEGDGDRLVVGDEGEEAAGAGAHPNKKRTSRARKRRQVLVASSDLSRRS